MQRQGAGLCAGAQGVKVDIPVLLNDTVGTLACARYGDGMHQTDTAMSLIVGTGAVRGLVLSSCRRVGANGAVRGCSQRCTGLKVIRARGCLRGIYY